MNKNIKEMKKIFLLFSLAVMVGCMNHDFGEINHNEIDENVKSVFGVNFDKNHDWCTTSNGVITISDIPSGAQKIQILAYVDINDTTTSLLVLNESNVNGKSSVSLKYDIPSVNKGIFVSDGKIFKKVNGNNVSMSSSNLPSARATRKATIASSNALVIGSTVESYSNKRGWVEGEMLFGLADEDYQSQIIGVEDYNDEYKTIFRSVIFSYFQNGRQYNNLPLIKESGYYNDKVYPITTGEKPIIVSPVYKCDKATKYGNEVYNSELYYYYFKESDLNAYVANGGSEIEFLTKLSKYKAIPFNQHFGVNEDDNIEKRASYTLIYWGDETPTIGTEGSYNFPKGYKIGFMIRTNTTADGGKKQGELYGDGRLNNNINFWGNFKSSKLGENGPRMGWITLNGKMLLCCESGTDSDFNDIIIEVEGGVEEIEFIPEFENNVYTFCFEDRKLGDYDMNDVVIKASRIDETTVEYKVVACGAYDKVYIMNIEGEVINRNNEVHSMFSKPNNVFINTVKNDTPLNPIVERIKVSKDFSFLNNNTQPYIYNATTNQNVYISKIGEDPHGIMIPYDFKYPIEKICIKDAYDRFNDWGANKITSTDWYKYPNEAKIY